MATLARLIWFASLLSLIVVFPALASGDPAPVAKRTVEGVATTPDGKPLAHVMLYLFGLPPGWKPDEADSQSKAFVAQGKQ